MDTDTDHFTLLVLSMRGNYLCAARGKSNQGWCPYVVMYTLCCGKKLITWSNALNWYLADHLTENHSF